MTNPEIKMAVDQFVRLIEEGAGDSEMNYRELTRLLDTLALAVHYADYTFDEAELPDPPRMDYQKDRRLVTERFPDFGYYNVVVDVVERPGQTEFGTGDAIDDIADIYADMKNVQWRWDRNGPDDALWYFCDMYGFHWKRHLRNLQLYFCEWEDSDGHGE